MVEKEARKNLKKNAAKIYFEVLDELGYKYDVDKDGDIAYVSAVTNSKVIAIIDSGFDEFVRIVLPEVKDVTSENRASILEACNVANLKNKGGKVYISERNKSVWVAYEAILNELNEDELRNALFIGPVVVTAAGQKFLEVIGETE
ncbi:YbjN domain-containing protein [uncultured Pseudomonas sp.]|uniref:YbjN domain-containing protein n=1 Tax=uncultured Pseudomonas sp. TaxID=114707 RepID=UPI00258D58B6|nr:YbjN domain-containing protein [uncultured Pseudomonas sp.]